MWIPEPWGNPWGFRTKYSKVSLLLAKFLAVGLCIYLHLLGWGRWLSPPWLSKVLVYEYSKMSFECFYCYDCVCVCTCIVLCLSENRNICFSPTSLCYLVSSSWIPAWVHLVDDAFSPIIKYCLITLTFFGPASHKHIRHAEHSCKSKDLCLCWYVRFSFCCLLNIAFSQRH